MLCIAQPNTCFESLESSSVLLDFSVRPFSLAAAVAGTYRRGRGVSVKLRSLTVRLFNHIRFGPFRIDLCCSRLCYERGIWQGWAFTMASEGEDGMNDHLFGFTSYPAASDGSWKDASTSYRRRVPHSGWDSSKSTVTKLRSLPISLLHLERTSFSIYSKSCLVQAMETMFSV